MKESETQENAAPGGTCAADCSALDNLDWAWINRAAAACGVTPSRKDAEEAVRIAIEREPLAFCECGVFRAIRWPQGQVEVLFTLSDITFMPNDSITGG